jgi:hypothetical protein
MSETDREKMIRELKEAWWAKEELERQDWLRRVAIEKNRPLTRFKSLCILLWKQRRIIMQTPTQWLKKLGLIKTKARRRPRIFKPPMSKQRAERERELFAKVNALQTEYADLLVTLIVYDRDSAMAHCAGPGGWQSY